VVGVSADIHIAFQPLDDPAEGKQDQQAHRENGAQHEEDIAQCDRQTEASLRLSSACNVLHMRSTGTVAFEAYRVRMKDLERNGLILMTISTPRLTWDQRYLCPSNSQFPLARKHALTV